MRGLMLAMAHQNNSIINYAIFLYNKSRKIVISTHINKPLSITFCLASIHTLCLDIRREKISSPTISHHMDYFLLSKVRKELLFYLYFYEQHQ